MVTVGGTPNASLWEEPQAPATHGKPLSLGTDSQSQLILNTMLPCKKRENQSPPPVPGERQGARREAWAENAAFLAQPPLAQTNPPDPDQWSTTTDMFTALHHLQNVFSILSSELLILPFPFSEWITRAQRQI